MTGVLLSPLSTAECDRRLRENVGAFFSDAAVWGRVGVGAAALRKRISYRNSFQTVLVVQWSEVANGTRIEYFARLHIFVIVFLTIWFGGAVGIGGLQVLAALLGVGGADAASLVGHVTLMLGGGLAVVGLGRWLARNEERFLVDFVASTMSATEVR